ncbi:MAG: FecR family protein [Bacteroidales bacterium]|nr:FecR family protein [Bacteroidales bacterium]
MNKDSEHIDDKLLLRFLLGEASQDEMTQVQEWLQLSEKNRKVLDDYEAIWSESGKLTPNPVAVDIPSAWINMSERIDKFESKKTIKTIPLKSKFIKISYSAAAILIIFIAIYQLILKPTPTLQIASNIEVIKNTLPDGSLIALNSNSTISYPKKFNKNERRIKLEGEAFFDVERNEEKPFIIEAGNAFVQVLGTKFNVKAYENSEIEVIVTEGLVKLYIIDSETLDSSSIFLKAGQKGIISIQENRPIYVSENIPDELAWMDYTLIFKDTDLKRALSLLEDHYNVKIKVSDKRILNCRLTTTFTNNSIDDIIEVIVATFEFEYTKENNTYTIKGDGCEGKDI